MSTYYAKRGDVGSVTPETHLLDGDGNYVDLNGATVRFVMRAPDAAAPQVAAAGTVVDAATGSVRYTWAAGDLDVPGFFRAEWEVTYAGGAVETFPADGWISVVVREDLDVES